MEAEKTTRAERMMKIKAKLVINYKFIVAVVAGCCLMAAPLTRAYKLDLSKPE